MEATKEGRKSEEFSPKMFTTAAFWKSFFSNTADIIILVVVLLIIRAFIVSPFQISGESMEQNLHDGELILTNKLVYSTIAGFEFGSPSRGDVVVFRPPHNKETFYIKRIIGLPGDVVSFEGRTVLVNGVKLSEPYIKCATFEDGVEINNWCNYDNVINQGELKVPEGSYFVMGDNRNNSTDSRTCFNHCNLGITHFVPKEDIMGKAWIVLWPFWGQGEKEGPSGLRFAPTYAFH